jgi:LysM repeat protein
MIGMASAFVVVPVIGAACGDSSESDAQLPPIVTTTSTTLPANTTTIPTAYYIVQSGDNLGNIARAFGVNLDELMALNNITNPNLIEVGQALAIPPSTLLLTLPGNTT